MFGLIDSVLDSATSTIGDFIEDPIGESIKTIASPSTAGISVIDGLSEGELRIKAIAELGLDTAEGLAIQELIKWYENK